MVTEQSTQERKRRLVTAISAEPCPGCRGILRQDLADLESMTADAAGGETMYVIRRDLNGRPKALDWASPEDYDGDERDVPFTEALRALGEGARRYDEGWTMHLVCVPRAEWPSWSDAQGATVLAEAFGGAR